MPLVMPDDDPDCARSDSCVLDPLCPAFASCEQRLVCVGCDPDDECRCDD